MRFALAAFGLLAAVAFAEPSPAPGAAPGRELGLPFFHVFDPHEYRGHSQVWGVTEDAAGLMYFGNYGSVLVYDGVRWDRIDVPGTSFVRGVAVDAKDTLWIAGVNELGYASRDATGRRKFVSLRDQLPEAARNFSELWRIVLTPQGPLFQSNTWLMRWNGRAFAVLALPGGNGWQVAPAGDTLWVSQNQAGWFTLSDDGAKLTLVPQTRPEVFDKNSLIFSLPGGHPGETIFGTPRRGLVLWNGKEFAPFTTDADTPFREKLLYRGTRLADGRLVLAVRQAGAFILDAHGRLLARLDEAAGLPGNTVTNAFAARDGTVWLSLERGMARVDARPWLTWFGPARGAPRSVLRPPVAFHGTLYLTSDDGLQQLLPGTGDVPAHLAPVPEFGNFLEGIQVADDVLLGFGDSIHEWRGPGTKPVQLPGTPTNVFDFIPSHAQPGRWFVLRDSTLHTYRRENHAWMAEGAIPELGHVRSLTEAADGSWWMGTPSDGVMHVKFPAATATGPGKPEITRFTAQNGALPAAHGWARVNLTDGRPLLRCEKGLFRLDASGKRWEPTAEYGARFADGSMTTRSLIPDGRGGVWIAARPAGEAELITTLDFGLFNQDGWLPVRLPQLAQLDDVTGLDYDEKTDLLWIGGHSGLIRMDVAQWRQAKAEPLPVLLLRSAENAGAPLSLAGRWQFPFARRALALQFGAPALAADSATIYESTLRGEGDPIVQTDSNPQREFSALGSGAYALKVRARGSDGRWSAPVEIFFTVLPPWWRSAWAWAAYGIVILGLVALFIASRTRALRRRAAQLETVVATRTEDLRRSNAELARLNKLELDEKIAAKLAEEKARLELLRYQLNPHFLLNAFTTLRGLVFTRPEAAGDMVAKLAEFCRFALTRTDANGGTVADEAALIETYLATEKSRWRDELTCSIETDPAIASVRLPPFLLQPLVENAVKYGGRTSPDHLEVRAHIAGDGATGLRIEVANTGAWVEADSPHRRDSTGLGLDNLRQRLRRYYPENHTLEVQSAGGWVRIVLHLRQPARDPFATTHAAD